MTAAEGETVDLQNAIAGVYGGPPEDFVRRRDVLAKELRAAGRREDASAVKTLRKPSRMAWALDAAALDAGEALDSLVAAVDATLAAQAAGGDVRGAIAGLRAAVREFAGHAARAADRAGHGLEQATLANAVLAVLGKPDAFAALRRAALAEVPEAGGLDFLSSLPAPAPLAQPAKVKQRPQERPSAPPPPPDRAGIEEAARESARQAAVALAAARERADETRRALRDVESQLYAVEEQLRQAELEARALRGQRDRARQEAEAAAARLLEAEKTAAAAERQRDRLVRRPD